MRGVDAFLMMVRKQFLVMLRYPVDFITSFAQIFIVIVMFSLAAVMFTSGGVGNLGGSNQSSTGAIMMYGLVIFMFLSDTLWSIGYSIRDEQYQGTLESLYLTPASKFASLVSRTVTILVWTGLLTIASVLFTQTFLGRLPFYNLGLAAYVLSMTLAGLFGLGFAFAAYTLLVKESAQSTANLLQFLLLIACGMFFPFRSLPGPILLVSRLLPLSYSVDLFRSTLMGYPAGFPELASVQTEIVAVTLFGLLSPLLGYWLYQRAEHQVRVTGTLAEF